MISLFRMFSISYLKPNSSITTRSLRFVFTGDGAHSQSNPEFNKDHFESEISQKEDNRKQTDFLNKAQYRYIYPEFLPDPNMSRRHWLCEKLERADMMARRCQIEIPEFYVGSVMSVSVSDPHSPGCTNRFVGICILREQRGLRSYFILRNIVDHQGIEIRYDMYNPSIKKIEVLKLEKRLDEHLVYLRDAHPEFSTFPFDMEPVPHHESELVTINPIKVKLKPRPWYSKWERLDLKGIESFEHVSFWQMELAKQRGVQSKSYEKFDLMKEYRQGIHEEDQAVIWNEVHKHHSEIKGIRKQDRKKKLLTRKTE